MSSTFLEGVGDEVIYACLLTILPFILITIFATMKKRYNHQIIHPDSLENVQTAREHLNRVPVSNPNRRQNESNCPVCLDDLSFGVETNCGHVFCASCIIAYWHYGSWLGGIKCPVCRQKVTLLLLCFTDAETRSTTQERADILNQIHDYNRRFSGEPRSIMDYLNDIPTLLRHCLQELFSWNGLMIIFRMRITICAVFGICYLISPLDIIPEAAFGLFGLLDDVFVLSLMVVYITIAYRELVASRLGG
ncbi:E3 ubiquitin-protein ligase RNF170-like [Octopus vulgaris]|uniref:E3 ubiquitin-protein ligase RNF170-like n=2 Tax=Octopus TaxID=6643 RepID=A0AA36FBB4_OCTVU|nr:E3 ubiquitin-protein ligase RNF170 [Octopus sinensis]XP_036364095.1 E3 ubiquitin-protein ligase RNF170 [Octopus sinensis]CAI9731675.1 E3 ubiquitin-protein ligase RNF170-like [Octopus vulgaris]